MASVVLQGRHRPAALWGEIVISGIDSTRAARFDLVTAAHHFLMAVLPLRHPCSCAALTSFIDAASGSRLASPDLESVLIRVLAILQPHTGGRLPSLVDRWLQLRSDQPDGLVRFRMCVEGVILYRGIGNIHVEQATAIVHARYAEPGLRQAAVAEAVGLTPSGLCAAFAAHTNYTFTEYLRGVRLDHAATLLTETSLTIKEVWSAVGYNDAANFVHDFKARFSVTPSEYRLRAGPPPIREGKVETQPACAREGHRRVLIVDDDQTTRETLEAALRVAGYLAEVRISGREAIEAVLRTRPEVILLDYHLPDTDGLSCLRTLRKKLAEPNLRPPVVLLTADWELERESEEIRALGGIYMSKLSDLDEVERVVHSLSDMHTLRADRAL